MMLTIDLRGQRFGILGAARSGAAAAGLLVRHGATVFVSDRSAEEHFDNLPAELRTLGVEFEFGGNTERVLEVETLVVSPGVPSDAPMVKEALTRGVRVVSELELASWFCRAPMVAITGTNGKTTATTLAGRMFADAKMPCVVAGNIGTAFSQVVEDVPPEGTAVLEVSSFQLDHIAKFRPAVAAILNITPDHLDRYGHSLEKYVWAKMRIFENQKKGDVLIYNDDDALTRQQVVPRIPQGVMPLPFSTGHVLEQGASVRDGKLVVSVNGLTREVLPTDQVGIPGEHNLANAMAATLAAVVRGVPVEAISGTLRSFKGVEHRLEFVRELDGITYVNDSKATNVDSVWYALKSFNRPLIVLIGGRDKGNEYARLSELVRRHVRAVVAIGESASKVIGAFSSIVPTVGADSMTDAVDRARAMAEEGDVVLLSPACASFDWFDNYEHRGKVFKELVMALPSRS
jgi:UDP-N-acetylmuramoylalanine--D-glutamate ligase